MIKRELSRLCFISSVLLFLEINFIQIEASVTLFVFCCFYLTFLENDMFSIAMDPCM